MLFMVLSNRYVQKIITLGGVIRDTFIQCDKIETLHLHTMFKEQSFIIMEEGRKIDARLLEYHVGGGAANSAVSFARLGMKTSCFAKLGNDQEGLFIIKKLAKEGVITDSVMKTDKAATGTSFIIPSPTGNRAVLIYRGANLTLKKQEIPTDSMIQNDCVYITSLSGKTASLLLPTVRVAKEHNMIVATNPGTSQLAMGAGIFKEALSYIDILVVNSFEAQLLMASLQEMIPSVLPLPRTRTKKKLPKLLQAPLGLQTACFTVLHFLKKVLSCGPSVVVVTNGKEGVYAATKDALYFHPSMPTDVVSTLGAGDAFGSTFVAYITQKKSIENALRAGVINSASVIQRLDTQTGLLPLKTVEQKVADLDPHLLQKFEYYFA